MLAFTIIWCGQIVSLLGTAMGQFALTLWAYGKTGEATPLAMKRAVGRRHPGGLVGGLGRSQAARAQAPPPDSHVFLVTGPSHRMQGKLAQDFEGHALPSIALRPAILDERLIRPIT